MTTEIRLRVHQRLAARRLLPMRPTRAQALQPTTAARHDAAQQIHNLPRIAGHMAGGNVRAQRGYH